MGQCTSLTCTFKSRASRLADAAPVAASRQCTRPFFSSNCCSVTCQGLGAGLGFWASFSSGAAGSFDAVASVAGSAVSVTACSLLVVLALFPRASQLIRPLPSRLAKISGRLQRTDCNSARDCRGCTFLSTACSSSKRSSGALSRSLSATLESATEPLIRTTASVPCSKPICRSVSSTPDNSRTGTLAGT